MHRQFGREHCDLLQHGKLPFAVRRWNGSHSDAELPIAMAVHRNTWTTVVGGVCKFMGLAARLEGDLQGRGRQGEDAATKLQHATKMWILVGRLSEDCADEEF